MFSFVADLAGAAGLTARMFDEGGAAKQDEQAFK